MRRISQARQFRLTPPSYDYLAQQPAGKVAEIMAAWNADLARESWQISHPKQTGAD